jgi:hypothetical protein
MALNELKDPLQLIEHTITVAAVKKEVYEKYGKYIPED